MVGCSDVSSGCTNCYAKRSIHRLAANPNPKIAAANAGLTRVLADGRIGWTGEVNCLPDRLDTPLHWKAPRRIFVNSQSDLFHEKVPLDFIDKVFAVMALCPQHTFQVLTKRPERMDAYMADRDWGDAANYITDKHIRPLEQALYLGGEIVPPLPNIWIGTSVEDQAAADERIPHLLRIPAAVRFLSCEPLLGPLNLAQCLQPDGEWRCPRCRFQLGKRLLRARDGAVAVDADKSREVCPNDGATLVPNPTIAWCIVGGESGPGARPMHPDWARSLRDQCAEAAVPFFFKQHGEYMDGRDWEPYRLGVFKGHTVEIEQESNPNRCRIITLCCVGKKRAGRLLDGVLHDAYPEASRG
jgi:protein gp37